MSAHTAPIARLSTAFAILTLLVTSGCSTVIEGRSQRVTVDSSPEGAECVFKQADDVVARVTTPGTAQVTKTKNDLVILCHKEGYESVSTNNHSDYSLASFGNMALWQLSFVGNAVDSLSGASNKYDSKVFVTLAPASEPASFPAPPGAPQVVKLAPETATGMSMQVPMPGVTITPEPVAVAAPVAPVSTASLITPGPGSAPAVNAAAAMGKAAWNLPRPAAPEPINYAQAAIDSSERPGLDITQ